MAKEEIPVWEKAALTIEETAVYTGIGSKLIRALAYASLNERGDFPAFKVGTNVKIPRLPLLKWLADTAVAHKNLQHAAAIVENAVKAETRRGRPRKKIIVGGV